MNNRGCVKEVLIGFVFGFVCALLLTILIFNNLFYWNQESRIKIVNNEVFVSFVSGWGHCFENYGLVDNQFYKVGKKVSIEQVWKVSPEKNERP
ncbi:MAG TPA: hypothetical protein PKM71_08765 [Candidatus Cloacimonas sp.]|nr:hypothetical protein [Candidatus Cloacimonas sp.]